MRNQRTSASHFENQVCKIEPKSILKTVTTPDNYSMGSRDAFREEPLVSDRSKFAKK